MSRRTPATRRRLLVAAGLAAVVLASWAFRFTNRGTVPPLDLYLYFYPFYDEAYRRLAAGALPLWNPYQLCGVPWLATLQGGFFYPLHAAYLVLPLPAALAVGHGLQLLLVAAATALFARRIGLGVAPALLASALFTLRGFIPISLGSTNYLDAACWMPVGALAVLELARRPSATWVALLAAATGLSFLAGYPQPTVYMLYTWATLLPAVLLREGADARRWLVTGALFAGAVALGALAAGAQLVPTAELVRSGHHRDLPVDAMAPFGPLSVARAILTTQSIAGSAFTYGVVALAMAAIALATRRHRALAVWAVALCLLSALLSFGTTGPLFGVYRTLPFLGMFRFPDRILSITDFAFAIAAGIGLDALRPRRNADRPAPARRAAMAAIAAVALVVVLAWRGWAPPERLAAVLAVAVAAGLLLGAATTGSRPTWIAAGLAALAVVELSAGPWAHFVSYGTTDLAAWDRYARELRTIGGLAGPDRVWFSGLATLQPQLAQKLATRYRLRAIDDYEPLSPGLQAEYFTYFTEGAPTFSREPWLWAGRVTGLQPPPGVPPPATRRRLLDLASTRFLVVPAQLGPARAEIEAFVAGAGFVPRALDGTGELRLFENPTALPRAFVTYRTLPAPAVDALLGALADPSFDPLEASYVDGTGVPPTADAPHGQPARIVVDGEREVELEAELAQPGLVVLGDAFYPGWTATIDGAPAPIVRTNHLFRGVAAPAGRHRIRFVYQPWSVPLGIACSIAGWLAIALLVLRGRRRPHGVLPAAGVRG